MAIIFIAAAVATTKKRFISRSVFGDFVVVLPAFPVIYELYVYLK